MPAQITRPGPVGVVSRSGTLTYEAVDQLSRLGHRPVDLRRHRRRSGDRHELRRRAGALRGRPGDQGGRHDRRDRRLRRGEAAEFVKANMTKPVVAFIAGQNAPPGKRMGHAGAIIAGGKGKAQRQDRGPRGGRRRGVPLAGRDRRDARQARRALSQALSPTWRMPTWRLSAPALPLGKAIVSPAPQADASIVCTRSRAHASR